jgi:hypothetical protein
LPDTGPSKLLVVKGNGAALVLESSYVPSDRWPGGVMSRLHRTALEYPSGPLKHHCTALVSFPNR